MAEAFPLGWCFGKAAARSTPVDISANWHRLSAINVTARRGAGFPESIVKRKARPSLEPLTKEEPLLPNGVIFQRAEHLKA